MRALFCLCLGVLASACFAPRPCTQALCPTSIDGVYRVDGWGHSVTVDKTVPPLPIVSDSEVSVLAGSAEFSNDRSVLHAAAGSSFRFEVSTASTRTAWVTVSTGAVTVTTSSSPARGLTPGVPFAFPAPR
jgi:hypothetical protein